MNHHNEVIRGEAAKQLLDNPLLQEAFIAVEANLVKALTDSPMGDEKTHNRLAIALQLLKQIEKSITLHIETGKMAQIQVEETLIDRVKRVIR